MNVLEEGNERCFHLLLHTEGRGKCEHQLLIGVISRRREESESIMIQEGRSARETKHWEVNEGIAVREEREWNY